MNKKDEKAYGKLSVAVKSDADFYIFSKRSNEKSNKGQS